MANACSASSHPPTRAKVPTESLTLRVQRKSRFRDQREVTPAISKMTTGKSYGSSRWQARRRAKNINPPTFSLKTASRYPEWATDTQSVHKHDTHDTHDILAFLGSLQEASKTRSTRLFYRAVRKRSPSDMAGQNLPDHHAANSLANCTSRRRHLPVHRVIGVSVPEPLTAIRKQLRQKYLVHIPLPQATALNG